MERGEIDVYSTVENIEDLCFDANGEEDVDGERRDRRIQYS
jgi:hypothetical protein